MALTTYRKLSEEILRMYYKNRVNDDATYSLRFIAEMIANEVAFYARKNAFENSAAGEVTYANDTFITTYKSLNVQYDAVNRFKYVELPSLPAALPNNQEITKVWPVGANRAQIVPISNHSKFSQDMLPPIRNMVLYYIEDGKIVFDNLTAYNFKSVNMSVVAGFPDGNLLDAAVSVPKNYEAEIMDKILARLNSERNVQIDLLNDGVALPS